MCQPPSLAGVVAFDMELCYTEFMTDAIDFKGLKLPELRAAAKAFAVDEDDVIAKAKAPELIVALEAGGVTWEMYQEMFHPVVPEVVEPEVVAPVLAAPVVPEPVEEEVNIITKEVRPKLTKDAYLIKMVRENPLFEVAVNGRKHKFTKTHPYVLMSPEDAEVVLEEDGFRQAHPSEVAEYYN